MTTRTRYTAEYLYPGLLFPESTSRSVEEATVEAVVAAQPDASWYAVTVREITEKLFHADDGEQTWVTQSTERVASWVVGEKVRVDDIEETDQNRILRSNIRANSETDEAVRTRCGNWQIADDYDRVLAEAEVA